MVSFTKEERVSEQNIVQNFGDFANKLRSGIFDKIAVVKNQQTEAVIISPDEYQKLEEIYELFEQIDIFKQIKDRLATPKDKYIPFDEVLKKQGL